MNSVVPPSSLGRSPNRSLQYPADSFRKSSTVTASSVKNAHGHSHPSLDALSIHARFDGVSVECQSQIQITYSSWSTGPHVPTFIFFWGGAHRPPSHNHSSITTSPSYPRQLNTSSQTVWRQRAATNQKAIDEPSSANQTGSHISPRCYLTFKSLIKRELLNSSAVPPPPHGQPVALGSRPRCCRWAPRFPYTSFTSFTGPNQPRKRRSITSTSPRSDLHVEKVTF